MSEGKFDDLLVQLGTGRWNFLYFTVVLWYCFFLPGQVLSIVFAVPSMSYTCKIPEEDEEYSVPDQNLVDVCGYEFNSSTTGELEERLCTDWEFDNSTYSSTLTSEYQLICGRNFLRATYHAMFMIGNLFGPPIAGVISDKYGRKIVAVTGGLIFGLTATILPFLHNFTAILALRFIMGFANLPTGYIWALEVCEPQKRSFVGIFLALPWALGTTFFGVVAYFARDWHSLQLIMSIPLMILLPAIWFLDESPRFLIVKGHHERALNILKNAAKWNKVKLPSDSHLRIIMKDIQHESESTSLGNSTNSLTESQTMPDKHKIRVQDSTWSWSWSCGLCSTANIRLITMVMTLCFCVSSLVFHGITLSAKDFSINIYTYIIIGGLAEVPAYIVPAYVVARFGRRIPLAICFFICSAALLILIIIPENISWLIMVFAMIGKLGISSAGQMAHLYLTELYPTEYRLQGLGTAIFAQRLGSIVAPLLVYALGPLSWWAPSVVMGVTALLASIATLRLPETLGAVLPDTLGDLEDLFARNTKDQNAKKNGATVKATGEMVPMRA